MSAPATVPFDAMAADYDAAFTRSAVGAAMRPAVWREIDRAFTPGQRVLEMSCGTGEDAAHLAARGVRVLATDISENMLAQTSAKAQRLGLGERIEVARLDFNAAEWPGAGQQFDGALSNFGGLNCAGDLRSVADKLAARLRPGARVVLCVMGPYVPWEWLWYLGKRQPAKAFRRLRGSVAWRGITIYYPSVRALRQAFAAQFAWRGAFAVGSLVPPSYAEPWAQAHPRALRWLNGVERRFERLAPLVWTADHYVATLERKP